MPELPEVEITARRLDAALRGATIESTLAPGINALKTFDPPLHAIDGATDRGRAAHRQAPRRRRRRRPARARAPDVRGAPAAVRQARVAARPHVAAAGPDRRRRGASCACASSGPSRRAWVKVLPPEGSRTTTRSRRSAPRRGPTRRRCASCSPVRRAAAARRAARPARDRGHRALVGRRDPLDRAAVAVQARPRPRRRRGRRAARGDRRAPRRRDRPLRAGRELPIPDKLPLPLQVHRHQGEPCPRCGATIEAVHYEDYVMCYCPEEQTGGAC